MFRKRPRDICSPVERTNCAIREGLEQAHSSRSRFVIFLLRFFSARSDLYKHRTEVKCKATVFLSTAAANKAASRHAVSICAVNNCFSTLTSRSLGPMKGGRGCSGNRADRPLCDSILRRHSIECKTKIAPTGCTEAECARARAKGTKARHGSRYRYVIARRIPLDGPI